ncbi:MAG TPA: sulfur carrier protein ThiS [Syntrophales bacterium]|nr:sulfur carrier protein ThiS [Syntrophales bacterium]HOL59220.1 sulfur carrier protein ThiS [Syntrophales bacterium]HPO35270.1 sulfur carrier protein ThiS [Syntrophales bacterium]
MAKVRINGREVKLGEKVQTVLDLILAQGLLPEDVVIEHNGKVLPRADWGKTKVGEGDKLEILSFVGGG